VSSKNQPALPFRDAKKPHHYDGAFLKGKNGNDADGSVNRFAAARCKRTDTVDFILDEKFAALKSGQLQLVTVGVVHFGLDLPFEQLMLALELR
jgi:hypothetical protein